LQLVFLLFLDIHGITRLGQPNPEAFAFLTLEDLKHFVLNEEPLVIPHSLLPLSLEGFLSFEVATEEYAKALILKLTATIQLLFHSFLSEIKLKPIGLDYLG
jgi:hypothetical protein